MPTTSRSSQINFCRPGGSSGDRLRNWKAGSSIAELLATFLQDFLNQNRCHDVGAAVKDTAVDVATLLTRQARYKLKPAS